MLLIFFLPGQVHLLTGLAFPVDGNSSNLSVIGRFPQDVSVGQSHSDLNVLSGKRKIDYLIKHIPIRLEFTLLTWSNLSLLECQSRWASLGMGCAINALVEFVAGHLVRSVAFLHATRTGTWPHIFSVATNVQLEKEWIVNLMRYYMTCEVAYAKFDKPVVLERWFNN